MATIDRKHRLTILCTFLPRRLLLISYRQEAPIEAHGLIQAQALALLWEET